MLRIFLVYLDNNNEDLGLRTAPTGSVFKTRKTTVVHQPLQWEINWTSNFIAITQKEIISFVKLHRRYVNGLMFD